MSTTISQMKRRAKELYRWCLVDGRLKESRCRQVIGHVLQARRRGYLGILGEFRRLLKLERARHLARVDTAELLQTDLRARLRKALVAAYGEALITEFTQSPELIGGMRIRVANDVYDGSVKAKLVVLARSFGLASEGQGSLPDRQSQNRLS